MTIYLTEPSFAGIEDTDNNQLMNNQHHILKYNVTLEEAMSDAAGGISREEQRAYINIEQEG